jgi:RNA polymerase sigma-70 factor (ECF subfamily)
LHGIRDVLCEAKTDDGRMTGTQLFRLTIRKRDRTIARGVTVPLRFFLSPTRAISMLLKKRIASEVSSHDGDAALVDGIRRGVQASFERLFHAHWDPLCQYAYCYLRSTDDAEEIVQRVFARIWENRLDWSVRGSVQDYLYLATRNASFDHLRHDSVARRWRERQVAELIGGSVHPEAQADTLVLAGEFDATIERAFAELPPKRRRICELRLAAGMSYQQIAAQLNISPKTVETQVARGLKYLRSRLAALRS